MTILITGGSGKLGKELSKTFPNSLSPSRQEFDITDKKSVQNLFKKEDINLVIHVAAMTKVRICEENRRSALQVNVEGTKNLVDAVIDSKRDAGFIYVSTACVFDGHAGMYSEDSIPYPENFYSLTKLLGEYEVKKLPNHLIIRTNFISKEKWPYPKAFTDRFGTYLFSDQVAEGIKDVQKENLQGIVHIVGDRKISMFELAKLTTPNVEPMTITDYSGPRLTMDMSLDTIRWKKYKLSN